MLARADGFRAALRYEGHDVAGLLALVEEAGQGLALLPARIVPTGVPLASPRLVHRTELLAGGRAGRAPRRERVRRGRAGYSGAGGGVSGRTFPAISAASASSAITAASACSTDERCARKPISGGPARKAQ